jgi:putative endonuclease
MEVVYILYSEKLDKFYIGRSCDLDQRLKYHNHPIESRKFTARGIPWVLKLKITCKSKDQAIRLEKMIKKMKSRKFIEALIADGTQVAPLLDKTA